MGVRKRGLRQRPASPDEEHPQTKTGSQPLLTEPTSAESSVRIRKAEHEGSDREVEEGERGPSRGFAEPRARTQRVRAASRRVERPVTAYGAASEIDSDVRFAGFGEAGTVSKPRDPREKEKEAARGFYSPSEQVTRGAGGEVRVFFNVS